MTDRVLIRAVTADARSAMLTGELGYIAGTSTLVLGGVAATTQIIEGAVSSVAGRAGNVVILMSDVVGLAPTLTVESGARSDGDANEALVRAGADTAETTARLAAHAAGPTWTTGTVVPAASAPIGSLYSRTGAGATVGNTLYVSRGAGIWNAVAGV